MERKEKEGIAQSEKVVEWSGEDDNGAIELSLKSAFYEFFIHTFFPFTTPFVFLAEGIKGLWNRDFIGLNMMAMGQWMLNCSFFAAIVYLPSLFFFFFFFLSFFLFFFLSSSFCFFSFPLLFFCFFFFFPFFPLKTSQREDKWRTSNSSIERF